MPLTFDSTVWIGVAAAFGAGATAVLIVALAAVGRSMREPAPAHRPAAAMGALRSHRFEQRYWHGGALAVLLSTLLATLLRADPIAVDAAALGALFGAWLVRDCEAALKRHPCVILLLGGAMGAGVMGAAIARYLAAASLDGERAGAASYAALFAVALIGAMMFASSVLALSELRGRVRLDRATARGHRIVTLAAVGLCVGLGYGFVTGQAAPFGLGALLAASALAAALSVHLMAPDPTIDASPAMAMRTPARVSTNRSTRADNFSARRRANVRRLQR